MAVKPPDDYRVGYKRPPMNSRFKKGQSGNPKGRPKGRTDVSAVLTRVLFGPISVRTNGTAQKIPAIEAVCKVLLKKGMEGDTRALREILNFYFKYVQQDNEAHGTIGPRDEGVSPRERLDILLDDMARRMKATEHLVPRISAASDPIISPKNKP